jgi:hypothetical protein
MGGGGVRQREPADSRESGVNGPGCPLNAGDIVMANNPPPPPVYPKWELWDSFKGTAAQKFHVLSGLTRYCAMHFVDAVSIFPLLRIHYISRIFFIIALSSFYHLFSFSTLVFSFISFSSTPLSSKPLLSLPSHSLSFKFFLHFQSPISIFLLF